MYQLGVESAWKLLRRCMRLAREVSVPGRFAWRGEQLQPLGGVASTPASAIVHWDGISRWSCVGKFHSATADFLELYFPVCAARATRPLAVGHLGQSLDGYVATSSGDSRFVNDAQNIVHLHRMRALCDAVIVGGATVRDDDPRLTSRLVSGDNPLRVVIDPKCRLSPAHQVFNDAAAKTLLVTLDDTVFDSARVAQHVEVLRVHADTTGKPDLQALMRALHARGCYSVFVEGGGITVSRFVDADLLDRLQIAVAPLFIGHGRAGMRIAARQSLQECLRPSHRLFRMGVDTLFDCDLREPPRAREHGEQSIA